MILCFCQVNYDTPDMPLSCVEQLDVLCCAASGLRGAEVRIDCTITDGPRSPAHVITYAEAKFKLQSTSERDEAVGQIWVSLSSNAAALYSVAMVQQVTVMKSRACSITFQLLQ